MRIHVTAAMAAVLLCAASSGSAQVPYTAQYMRYGAGGASCGTWLKERKGTNYRMEQWVLGWVSASGGFRAQG